MSSLIDHQASEWREDIISDLFCDKEQRNSLSIPLSCRTKNDELTWAYSKDREYSVKTAYMLGKGLDFEAIHTASAMIWGMEVSPKV